jgi:hypothetical protein
MNISHTTTKRTARTLIGLAALTVIGVVVAPNSAQAAGTWQYLDTNHNGRSDIAAIDRNGDGLFDEAWIDTNEDGRWDAVAYDYDGDSTFEWFRAWSNVDGSQAWIYSDASYNYTFIDRDGNGRFETHYFDGNRDGRAEWVRIDANSDGHADSWVTVGAATSSGGSSATSNRAANDMMVQHIVTMNQLRIYGSRLFG